MTTYDQLLALMTTRRSIRSFSSDPIEWENLKKILEAGRIAPSVENIQPWEFHVVLDSLLKTELMKTSCYGNFVAGSSVFIVLACDKSSAAGAVCTMWNPREMEYSCAMAAYSMMLAATSMGIGSCWVSLHHGPAHQALKLKEHQMVVGGLMLGSIKKGDEEASREPERKPLGSLVTYYEETKKKAGK